MAQYNGEACDNAVLDIANCVKTMDAAVEVLRKNNWTTRLAERQKPDDNPKATDPAVGEIYFGLRKFQAKWDALMYEAQYLYEQKLSKDGTV